MRTLTFNTTPSICIERGAAGRLAERVRAMNCRSVLLVTDPGVLAAGLMQPLIDGFAKADIPLRVFSDVQADPPEHVIQAAVQAALACSADCVIGFGGGSSLDAAKLAALLARSGESLASVYGIEQTRGPRLPLILVPTTAGTGSEVTAVSVVTTASGEKNVVISPILLPDLAVLDASLTLGLPTHVTAATGIDAMVHAIEAYTSRERKNPISDCLAREALRLLAGNLERACSNGADVEARENMLLGACLAGMAFANSPVAAVHALAYPLGARFHLPHGLSNSLVLAPVLRFNLDAVAPLYAELADIVLPGVQGDAHGKARALAEHFAELPARLNLPTRLREVGITEQDLEALARDAMNQTRLLGNNPRVVSLGDVQAIYREVL
ncbi:MULTISPECIES: iron-containing alcohol dehydrogenase [Pseudomonas aeruginosa group]|uniref:iron-containing alcohol dehydrogenase n=1 Tax=Pseudomonas aeruginosa group TaxID=136841 RepID=UPI0005B79468|nr:MULTISPECIES: iron-containing alcohol dehydrogenase [Pseudomonas aeruginosa group]MDK2349955.1 iron-containing alcohol dehydrogenase [Pseudomonas paraeruginosa]MEA8483690.1 iron-containing alcohol dehydrogenase [Pseudomonas aeruginosa]